jgi:hypothetical protein
VSCDLAFWYHVVRGGGLVVDAGFGGFDAGDGAVRLRIVGACFTGIRMGGLGGIVGGVERL